MEEERELEQTMSDNVDNIDLKALDSLSPEERAAALEILKEYAETGSSQKFEDLKFADFDEVPVDINTFLHDRKYLGNALYDQDGRFTLFPYWEEKLHQIFPDNVSTAYNTIVLTGAIGLGKTLVADICLLYLLYRLLCLKDPYLYYGMQPIDKISISFMNVTIENAKGVALDKMNQMILASEWFMSHGEMAGSANLIFRPEKHIELIAASSNNQIVGRALFASFEDEANFSIFSNPEKQKKKMMKIITQIDARMKSRFMRGTYLPTLNIIASSKDTEQSFLEEYIDNKRQNESKTTLIVDEPQWIVDERKDSAEKFWVGIGNKFLANELIPLDVTEAELDEYRNKGYDLWQVPIGYLETFQLNLDEAICSIIGIATASSLKYISGLKINQAKTDTYSNPFVKDIISVGNDPEDHLQYANFFDISKINQNDLEKPLFIHLDMSMSGDKTGIAGVWITGRESNVKQLSLNEKAEGNTEATMETIPTDEIQNDLHYKLAFSVSVEAPKGAQVSFAKNRNFIRWLRDSGFAIKGVSSDTFQSAQIQQDLKSDGFKTEIVSVDRVTKNANGKPVCLPYHYLKSAIYERRITMYSKCDLLTDELIGLERKSDGHVDHTKMGINCLTGDTKISLVDGREVTIKDLVNEYENGKENYVYTVNENTLKIEPKLIEKAYKSGTANKLIEITLDNGQKIRCTPEHRFMLRNGEYCQAKDLINGESLMPLYRKFPENTARMRDYRLYYVIKIKYLKTTEDVYDLTIRDNHNFALTAGIFVHNSKDQADAMCLHGDTEIYLLSGEHKTIKELYDNNSENCKNWVLAYNTDTHKIEPVQIKSVINNGLKNNLIKLTLDNGKSLICTDDHKVLTRDGTYIEAKDSLNVSLMPFTYENKIMFNDRDYPYVYNPNEDGSNSGVYLHKIVAENLKSHDKQQKINSCESNQWVVIHHIDCNRFNNNPENLEYLTNIEHSKIHCELNSSEMKRKQLRDANKKLVANGKHPFQNLSTELRTQLSEKAKKIITKYNKSEQHKKRTSEINKQLFISNKHPFQLHKYAAHSDEANAKRDATCKELYNGTGFKSNIIQQKCRQTCLEHNGYDNPWHSKEKQHEMKLSKLKNAYEKVLEYLNTSKNDSLSLLDFRIACYALGISGVSLKIDDIIEANINIDTANFNYSNYENLRTKGNCVKIFLKEASVDNFTYEEFLNFYNTKCKQDKNFYKRFKNFKPSYNEIVKLGFNLYNHRVVKIENYHSDFVYDIQLDKIHNFALTSGIFVHNCGALFLASRYSEEFSYSYGDSLDATIDVNVDEKQALILDLQQEILNIRNDEQNYYRLANEQENEEKNYYSDIADGIIII